MSPTINAIKITRGDDINIDAQLIDGNGDPVNLTGMNVILTVKRTWGGGASNVLIQKTAIVVTPLTGQIQFQFTDNETTIMQPDIYVYDIQLNDSFDFSTFLNAKPFIVVEDVTDN